MEQCNENDVNFGDRLYVVYASQIETEITKGLHFLYRRAIVQVGGISWNTTVFHP